MDKETELLKKLKPMFDHMLSYLGDDELISSCNDEYCLDPNDFIVTDGLVTVSMQKIRVYPNGINDELAAYDTVNLTTSVRGATHVIICEVDENGKYTTDLRVDESTLNEITFDKIVKSLENIKKNSDSSVYYIKEYRGEGECVLPQTAKVIDLLTFDR